MSQTPNGLGSLDLVISIVNYKSWRYLRGCLESLNNGVDHSGCQIYVVDNNSQDNSCKFIKSSFPSVNIIQNRTNVGFGCAHNQVIKRTNSKYILILNPDIRVPHDSVGTPLCGNPVVRMLGFMEEHPNAGAVGCRLLNPDSSLQYSCRRFPNVMTILLRGIVHLPSSIFHRAARDETRRVRDAQAAPWPIARVLKSYFLLDFDHRTPTDVDWVTGACMLLRRQALEQKGLFDEKYFLYYEDVDLCYRMWPDWKVFYYPHVYMVHHHLRQSHKLKNAKQLLTHIRSVSRFFSKFGLFPHRPGTTCKYQKSNIKMQN